MRRLLITGGSSYLGQHLVPLALASRSFELLYTFHQSNPVATIHGHSLNILDQARVHEAVQAFRPDIIIHTIGSNRGADMDRVIRQGTHHVTQAAANLQARLVHLSTDVIFDGRSPPYDETAQPCPINAYGRAKAAAETVVATHTDHVIVRTSLIYGLKEMDQGTRWMVEALRAGKPIKLFDNQRRNPIWVETLCRACLELASIDYIGVLNVAGRETVTRSDFALKMLDWWQIAERATMSIGPATGGKWPLDCELDIGRATALLSTPLPGVSEVLADARRRRSSKAG